MYLTDNESIEGMNEYHEKETDTDVGCGICGTVYPHDHWAKPIPETDDICSLCYCYPKTD